MTQGSRGSKKFPDFEFVLGILMIFRQTSFVRTMETFNSKQTRFSACFTNVKSSLTLEKSPQNYPKVAKNSHFLQTLRPFGNLLGY